VRPAVLVPSRSIAPTAPVCPSGAAQCIGPSEWPGRSCRSRTGRAPAGQQRVGSFGDLRASFSPLSATIPSVRGTRGSTSARGRAWTSLSSSRSADCSQPSQRSSPTCVSVATRKPRSARSRSRPQPGGSCRTEDRRPAVGMLLERFEDLNVDAAR